MKLADEYDKEFQQKYSTDLDTALIFAGLFSAVSSAFIIQIEPQLIGTPPTIIVVAQSMLYISLFATLLAALLAVLGKQWIMYYQAAGSRGTIEERGLERQRKLDGLVKWKFDAVLQLFPLLLQLALLLFACSLSVYLWTVNRAISTIVIVLTSCGLIAYFFLLASAAIFPDSPFQTPLTPLVARLASPALRFLRFIHIQVRASGKKILSATSSHLADHLLPRFAERPSTAAATDPNIDIPVTEASPEVSAVLWVLGTSTDPTTIGTAAEMAVDIQWPIKLDLRPTGTVLARVANTFQSCFDFRSGSSPSQAVHLGMENLAITCGRIYCSLRHNIRATNSQDDFRPYLLLDEPQFELEFDSGTELDNVLIILQEGVGLNVQWEKTSRAGHNWLLYTFPSLRAAFVSRRMEIDHFFAIFVTNGTPTLDIIGFTNYLCCVCTLISPIEPRLRVLVDKSDWRDYLLTRLLNDLHSSTIDGSVVERTIHVTAELARKCTAYGDRRNNLIHSLQLFQAVSHLCPTIPQLIAWEEVVISACGLARVGNTYDLGQVYSLSAESTPPSVEADTKWIYMALEHVQRSLKQSETNSTTWDHNTTYIVDSLMQVLACGRSHIRASPPLECLDLILQALSEPTDVAYTALLVLHRARHHWFPNADLRPHMQRHSIVHHLGVLARRFVRPTLLPDDTHELYLDIIQTIAAEPEWRSFLFAELPTWIEMFLFYRWEQRSHTSDAFIFVTRSVWAPDFDHTQWQLQNFSERCAGVAFEALANTWERYDFGTSSAVKNFFPMARWTITTVLDLQPYWNQQQEEFDYRPMLPPHLLPVFSSRLCKSLRQAAINSRNASHGVGSSRSMSISLSPGVAQFLEDTAQKLTTALQPEVAALNVLAEETNGPWWKLRTDLHRDVTALEETYWVDAGHD
ncbi:hypothetical protein C8R46DRAFT_1057179 [Mycena filopes]|nr:hypothetical protein C8R46DRAFT_1057179 [Mycena filopes]